MAEYEHHQTILYIGLVGRDGCWRGGGRV